jgi:hypothetical protein
MSSTFTSTIATIGISRHVRCSVAIGGKADIEQAALRTRFMSTRFSVRGRLVRHWRLAQATKLTRGCFWPFAGGSTAVLRVLPVALLRSQIGPGRQRVTTIQRFYLLTLH